MDCLDARRVLRQRDDAAEAQRDAALAHLDGCAACAALGPSLDPLLLFRRLPQAGVTAEDTARMREAVAVLRRAPADPTSRGAGATRGAVALRLAAAVATVACGLWLAPGPFDGPTAGSEPAPARLAGVVPEPEYLPSVETISDAYVATQITEGDLTLVILANVDVPGG